MPPHSIHPNVKEGFIEKMIQEKSQKEPNVQEKYLKIFVSKISFLLFSVMSFVCKKNYSQVFVLVFVFTF